MSKDKALKLAAEFDKRFISMNGIDVPERVSVPRDEWRALHDAIKQALEEPVQEPMAKITGVDEYGPMLGWYEHWVNFPVGTKLYTTPPAAQQQLVLFPTMLRKMWSGSEVQAWLDENVNKDKNT